MPKFKTIDAWIGAVVVAAVLWGAFVIWTTPAPPPSVKVGYERAQTYVDALNEYRAARRLPPLRLDERLTREAKETASENARFERLKHRPGAAEVLASNGEGFERAVDQWDKSPGHHSIITDRKYRRVGCAEVRRAGRCYCCARFR